MTTYAHAQPMTRDAAVELARQGDTARAIVELRQLARESDDPRIRYDLMTILDWDGKASEVVKVWRRMGSPVDLPDYVRVALVDALIEQVQWSDADKVIEHWLGAEPNSVDALFFAGQVKQATGDRLGALHDYQRAQALAPENQKIRSRTVALLTALGAVSVAERMTDVPSLDLKASLAAQQVRWGLQVPPPSTRQTYDRLDTAITSLRSQIADVSKEAPENIGLLRRLHADLAVALSDRQDFAGVIDVLPYLETTGGIPGYVKVVQGDALLATRQPEQAQAVFEAVLAEQPKNQQAQQGLLGALIALGDWSAAYALVDSFEPQQTLRLPRSPVPYANDAWLDARIQSVLVRSWAGQNEHAWQMMHPWLAGAPAEPDLQIAAATVATARGLPRLGEHHASVAYTLAPQSKASRLALGRAQMSRAQWT
jgi:tetratricopeptide (TPR) repeat protein